MARVKDKVYKPVPKMRMKDKLTPNTILQYSEECQ